MKFVTVIVIISVIIIVTIMLHIDYHLHHQCHPTVALLIANYKKNSGNNLSSCQLQAARREQHQGGPQGA